MKSSFTAQKPQEGDAWLLLTWFSARWVCKRTPEYDRASFAAAVIRSLVTVKGEQGARPMRNMEYLKRAHDAIQA